MNQREHHKQGQTKKEKNINNKNSKINVDVFCIIHVGWISKFKINKNDFIDDKTILGDGYPG